MCYLDYLQMNADPTSERVREDMKIECQEWIQHSDFRGSLNDAYRIWDSVSSYVEST